MPYSLTFDPQRRRIAISVSPPLSGQEGLECLRQVRHHPEYQPHYSILLDMRGADRPPSHTEGLQFGDIWKTFFPRQSVAILLPSNPTTEWGYISITAFPECYLRFFTDLSKAEAWLATDQAVN